MTVCVFTVLVVAYIVTYKPRATFSPGKSRPIALGREINYIGIKQWDRHNGGLPSNRNIEGSNSDTAKVPTSNCTYIITQTFGGQMTRAIRNMMLQQCWAVNLGRTSYIVEPFSANSDLYHSSTFWNNTKSGELHDAARFSEFYDLEYYNVKSKGDKSTELVTWEHFLKMAPRHCVVLVIPQQPCRFDSKQASKKKFLSNCSFTKVFQDFVTGLKRYNFHVVKIACVYCSVLQSPLTLKELHDELYTGHNFSKVTILMNMWRNFGFMSSWLELPEFCKLSEDPSRSTRLRPSLMVTNHAQYYKNMIIGSHGIVAVMLRIERFLTQQVSGKTKETLTLCVNKTLDIYDRIKKQRKDLGAFLTLDIGRFGSHVMQSSDAVTRLTANGEDSMESISSLVENTIRHLYKSRFTLKSWENTFIEATGGITEMGYIAMLQRTIATEADCLILMGGGSFQQVAAHQYMKNHPNPSSQCVYKVCVTPSFDKYLA